MTTEEDSREGNASTEARACLKVSEDAKEASEQELREAVESRE